MSDGVAIAFFVCATIIIAINIISDVLKRK